MDDGRSSDQVERKSNAGAACHGRGMSRIGQPRTRIERAGADRARALRRRIANDIRQAREDAGLSLRRVAASAGVSHATLSALERDTHDPTLEVLARVGSALGLDLSLRLFPGTGPRIRDHVQAAMVEALLRALGPGWRATPEVWVSQPVRGVIDVLLESHDVDEPLVSTEAHSELRRLEHQLRWAGAKSEALAAARGCSVSRLLLLRDTRRTRAVVAEHAATVGAAYPASSADALEALADGRGWPGDTLLWVDVWSGGVRLRQSPPRGITVGR